MKELRITNGLILVDDEDAEWIKKHSWSISNDGYPRLIVGHHAKLFLHRVILKAKEGQIVDHINGNKLDNRKENLRFCTSQQNQFNRKVNRNNTTGYKGVAPSRSKKRFICTMKYGKKTIYGGTFDTAEEAALKYNEVAKIYYGEFARLNQVTL